MRLHHVNCGTECKGGELFDFVETHAVEYLDISFVTEWLKMAQKLASSINRKNQMYLHGAKMIWRDLIVITK